MSISETLKEKILRYYYVEKWRVGTISTQLNVHHTTIKRVLSDTGLAKYKILVQKSMIDDYLPFILETLERHPTLTASRLYGMVVERGYPGGQDHFRHLISCYRPKRTPEAYLRLRTLPGEQAQVDWGHFGHITIGKAKRPLMAFVMVLSYSRKIFLHFFLNARMESFLTGHQLAFDAFGGVARVLLYDNLKSAVLERMGDAIHFNPTLLSFASHYRFEPRPVAVARGNEKGRVERAIRFVRDNFFAARTFNDIDDLNKQAQTWCQGYAQDRPCPEDKSMSVKAVFLQEQGNLLSIPDNPFPAHEVSQARVGKTPYVRFDLNDYSVPYQHTQKTLTIHATTSMVTILDNQNVIATHTRSFDKARQIETQSHIDDLLSKKKQASQHRGQNRITHNTEHGAVFLKQAASNNIPLKSLAHALSEMMDDYGAQMLDVAMNEALSKGLHHQSGVRLILQRLADERREPPKTNIKLSINEKAQDVMIKPHSLEGYDFLNPTEQ